ncbi:hypothetical protein Y1Q_0006334 [Alligator mississippiensis]|uniref:Uncharacterized protein n=1 Tax=Alligator mississippiensis TaxID=8496 RepID=A0A151NXQ7_ALLMI|nr:hypothetical protein Y1Q_0006334 [Alligator mississippiensis]
MRGGCHLGLVLKPNTQRESDLHVPCLYFYLRNYNKTAAAAFWMLHSLRARALARGGGGIETENILPLLLQAF